MGSPASLPSFRSFWKAKCSATQAPVMLAVRVPPSACSTSQSMLTCRCPIADRLTTARSERPIRRWISCVRPDCLPRAASRSVRVWVERGSMPYSAITLPRPELRIQGGTRSSTEAVHSTCVSPNRTRHEASAWREKPGSSEILRSWSGARPDGRTFTLLTTVQRLKEQALMAKSTAPDKVAEGSRICRRFRPSGEPDHPAAAAVGFLDDADHRVGLEEDHGRD